jgi:Flp pilus assembly protein TadD
LKRERFQEAEAILKGLAQQRAGDPETINLLAAAVYPQLRFAEAVSLLTRANDLDPELVTVFDNLQKAQAALAAEILGSNANTVKAVPQ